MRIRTRLAALAAIPALVSGVGLATATAASAARPPVTGPFNYEVDTGGSWWLSNTPISEPGPGGGGYADAGVVVDLGPLSSLTGITVTGSGPLSDNIWISNGNDEAAVPGGPHPLSGGVDFAYGFDNHDGTFYMASGHFGGQTVSLATLQAYYTGDEAFAWVGLTNANGAATGHVVKVNGAPAAAYVKISADGTASAR